MKGRTQWICSSRDFVRVKINALRAFKSYSISYFYKILLFYWHRLSAAFVPSRHTIYWQNNCAGPLHLTGPELWMSWSVLEASGPSAGDCLLARRIRARHTQICVYFMHAPICISMLYIFMNAPIHLPCASVLIFILMLYAPVYICHVRAYPYSY